MIGFSLLMRFDDNKKNIASLILHADFLSSVIAFKVWIQSSNENTKMSLIHFERAAIKPFNYQTLKF